MDKRKVVTFAIIGIFVLLFALTIGRHAVTSNSFCQMCHGSRPEGKSFAGSIHNGIRCFDCHQASDKYASILAPHISSITRLGEFFNGKTLNPNSDMGQSKFSPKLCFKCHNDGLIPTGAPRLGHVMDADAHHKHINAGLICTTCHNRVAHLEKTEEGYPYTRKLKSGYQYVNYLQMRIGCWRCHQYKSDFKSKVNGKVPPKNCNTCHYDKRQPDFHRALAGKEWRQRHGVIARNDMAFCQKCHENEGMIGAKTGVKTCYSCHQVVVPHDWETKDMTKNWDKIHYLQKDRSLCLKCHKENSPSRNDAAEKKDPDFCHKCHHRNFAKDAQNLGISNASTTKWKSFHFKVVKGVGAEKCFNCHKPSFCASCHVSGKKPAPGAMTKFDKKYWSTDHKGWQPQGH